VTDAAETSPRLIKTLFFDSVVEALAAVEGAERLNLGVTLRNQLVEDAEDGEPTEDAGALSEEWIVDIFDEIAAEESGGTVA
jgi:hypothetical protein